MNPFRKNRGIVPYRHTGRRPLSSPLLSFLFFPGVILYHELLLRAFDRNTDFFDLALLRVLLFSAAAGLVIFLLLDLLPWRKAARIAGGVVIGLGIILFCVERGCRATFGVYYGVTFMGGMAGDVAGGFGSTVVEVVLGMIPFILLSFVPLVAFILLRQSVIPEQGQEAPVRIILAALLVAFQLTAYLLSTLGPMKSYYTYEFTANTSIPHFGLLNSVRLELEYAVAGVPSAPLGAFLDDPVATPSTDPDGSAEPSADPSADVSQRPIPTGPNTLDIDFEALAESETNETIQSMHQYFASLTPSQQNEYTGMFEGKNLILITAEGFATPAIDEELTPTLYKLTHEGFVFNNFYQPDWTQSTCGGEFAITTGVIPNWVSSQYGNLAAQASIDKYMPTTLAHLFAPLGYSVPAWHNGQYDYYKRNQYLTNFGYDYAACDGGGLEIPYSWPRSDVDLIEATADSYIQDYADNGTLFHAYYMTISGHGPYNFTGHNMAIRHQAEVEAKYPDLSPAAQAYLACNMELDLALKCLVDKLEAAGIADDTLIVMTGDHYPYLLVMENGGPDYYNELRGFEDTESDTSRYRNSLLMWSGCIEEPIVVDTPCSSIDIVPTICNLFGLDYDSRLYSGRDIFADNYEADQYSNCMPLVVFANKGKGNAWITAAGTYECSTKTFTPSEGIELEDEEDYVKRVNRLVAAKINYSKLIVQEDYYKYVFADSE